MNKTNRETSNKGSRVLARLLAEELTEDELIQMTGGASGNAPSFSGPIGRQDDVITDDV